MSFPMEPASARPSAPPGHRPSCSVLCVFGTELLFSMVIRDPVKVTYDQYRAGGLACAQLVPILAPHCPLNMSM